MKFGFGQPATRREDDPLIRGTGRYVADVAPAGTLHAVVLRSPHAHARFRIADVAKARALPGVKLILTGGDIAELGPMPCLGIPPGVNVDVPPYPMLAQSEVRHVGDAVAFIVADTTAQAKGAAEAIAVDYEALPHVVDPMAALKPGAPVVWPQARGNVSFDTHMGDQAATSKAFTTAARVVSLTLMSQRIVANYLDTRGVIAEYDANADKTTLTLSSQGSHLVRDVLKGVLKIPAEKLRVITPDVGGGFGAKLFPYREYALAAFAAKKLGRPVKWVGERIEHFLGDTQGRANVTTAKLALDDKGRFLALDVDLVADMGAYLSLFAPYVPVIGAGMLPGVYDFPACHIRVRGVYTNTVPVDAYRGAGRPEAAYVIERLVDAAARDLGIAPDTLRKRNFIAPRAMPYTTPTGKTYDSGEFAQHMSRAQEVADWAGFRKRHADSRKAHKLRGIGLATYIEACGNNGPDTARLSIGKDGVITVLIGTQSTGQGHHTAYAQLIAEHLGVPLSQVNMVQGDTAVIASGPGTGGSSSMTVGGVAVEKAAKTLADNVKDMAAEALETSRGDLELADGAVRVVGTDRLVTLADLAKRPGAAERLAASHKANQKEATFPNGTHVAEVEIDPDTGQVAIVNYVVVDDFGATINPLLLEGQVHGGAAQGIGQAFMERAVYDTDSGQLLTASLMDYALPRAIDVPAFTFETRNVPCVNNPLGLKGAGEAGAIGSSPAVMNAIVDALWRAYRIRHVDMPATPERLWQAIEEGRRVHTL